MFRRLRGVLIPRAVRGGNPPLICRAANGISGHLCFSTEAHQDISKIFVQLPESPRLATILWRFLSQDLDPLELHWEILDQIMDRFNMLKLTIEKHLESLEVIRC